MEKNGGARISVEECLLREEEATGSNPVESMGVINMNKEKEVI